MTDKLSGIKPGDRVRVTFEGCMDMGDYFVPDAATSGWVITPAECSAPTFQIERIEPPLKVGDRVLADRTTWWVADIRQTAGGTDQVAVWNDQDGYSIYERADLERIA